MRAYDRVTTCTRCGAGIIVATDGNGRLTERIVACRCPAGPTAPMVCTVCDEPVEHPGLCERCERIARKGRLGVMAGSRRNVAPVKVDGGRICPDCDTLFAGGGAAVWCPPCSAIRRKRLDRERRAAKRAPSSGGPGLCERCGERERQAGPGAKYCPPCSRVVRRARENARAREKYAAMTEEEREAKRAQKRAYMAEWNAKRRREGEG